MNVSFGPIKCIQVIIQLIWAHVGVKEKEMNPNFGKSVDPVTVEKDFVDHLVTKLTCIIVPCRATILRYFY